MAAKTPIEFTSLDEFGWEPVPGNKCPGIRQKVISRDPDGRYFTRVIEYEPGTDTTANGVMEHEFYEEVYVIQGSMTDLRLGKTFTAGSVASRPPHMLHGPWKTSSTEPTRLFEVDYVLDEKGGRIPL